MGTKIRSEVSKKREYWLPKHRQLELVHFCLQYPEWMDRLDSLNGYPVNGRSVVKIPEKNGSVWKPVEEIVEERILLEEKIGMVESAARKAADDLYMLTSLGLMEMDDQQFDEKTVIDILCLFMNRDYDESGQGGLFTLRNPKWDMRETEIWYQMMAYLEENER